MNKKEAEDLAREILLPRRVPKELAHTLQAMIEPPSFVISFTYEGDTYHGVAFLIEEEEQRQPEKK